MTHPQYIFFFFFFNDTAPTEIYTLSLHDALPIFQCAFHVVWSPKYRRPVLVPPVDRKSTRLNSSHVRISYAVFCLKKKTKPHDALSLNKTKNITNEYRPSSDDC